jgi:hypothetical protein
VARVWPVTEQRWLELGTGLHAHKLEILRIAGRLAQRSREMAECGAGATVDAWSEATAQDAQDLASQVESLVRRTDALLDDTAVMNLDDVADE